MSGYYEDVYLKRLNRYGLDYQSRIQGQREKNFDNYLLKSLYRVNFSYEDKVQAGSLERYKQDYTETQAYLLTKIDLVMPSGTVLKIVSQDDSENYWMVWWLEKIEASGYNRYVMLRMTNEVQWEGLAQPVWSYFRGPGKSTVDDAVKSASNGALYLENNNLHMLIAPYVEPLKRDSYFEITYKDTKSAYVIREFDVISTPGVAYISVDPVPIRKEESKIPPVIDDSDENSFWLNGGN